MYGWPGLVLFIASTLQGVLWLYFWIVIASAVMSWIEPNPYNPIVRFIYSITEPVFEWVREHLPVFFGGLDFSPVVVIIVIELLQQWLIPTVAHWLLFGA